MAAILKGNVFDQQSALPLEGASILLAAGPGPAADICPLSGADGSFEISGLAPGRWRLRVVLAGYREGSVLVELPPAGVRRVSVGLVPS